MAITSTSIAFHKYHGCGNDFIVIDTTSQSLDLHIDWSQLAPRWCHRQFGIGADQLLVVTSNPHDPSRLLLRILNNDGSPAGMCGNGLRCIAKYACDVLNVPHNRVHIDIGQRTYPVDISRNERGEFSQAHVAMGQPDFEPSRIPVAIPAGVILDNPARFQSWKHLPESITRQVIPIVDVPFSMLSPQIAVGLPASMKWRATCLSMGNPHAVIFLDSDLDEKLVQSAGPILEHASCFPSRCNIHFAKVTDSGTITLLTWERGSGPTLACGSGACAVAVAGLLLGHSAPKTSIRQRGGTVQVHINPNNAMVTLVGPATHVYSGNVSM